MGSSAYEFLKLLLSTPSPSGGEARGQKVWLEYVKEFADAVASDAYGNATAVLNPEGRPRILVGGHADELTFLIQHIDEQGFLYFTPAGGQDPALARGQRVVIHTAKGSVLGVIGALAIHLQDRSKESKAPEWHDLYIDIGARNRAEAQRRVRVGDFVTYAVGFAELANHVFVARACDNRIGTFVAAEVLRALAAPRCRAKLKACVVVASTIQEENGLYGAAMVGWSVHPDAALLIDVGHATDIPAVNKKQWGDVKLGKGPIISRGSVNHPVLIDRLEQLARTAKIPIQLGTDPRRSGTDADAIFTLHGGIPSAAIGVPNRYMHSPVECISTKDLEATVKLVQAFALSCRANEKFVVPVASSG